MSADIKMIRGLLLMALICCVLGASAYGVHPALLFGVLALGIGLLVPNRNGGR